MNVNELKIFIQGVCDECINYGRIPHKNEAIGETAEMSKVYTKNNVDLIGCIIGLKNEKYFINNIESGDIIINLPSIGPHTNGFTLLNTLIDEITP